MKLAALVGLSSTLLLPFIKRKVIKCISDAEKAAEGLDKIYEETPTPRTPAELEAYLQDQSKTTGRPPAFATLNAGLKSITSNEALSGFKIDLSSQLSKHFQLGGTWQYSKNESGFSLNTAVIADALSQDANFAAGTYHDNGKIESRGMVKLGGGFNAGVELMFQGPDTKRAYYSLELLKSFYDSTMSHKGSRGSRSFTFMQTLFQGCYAGFDLSYVVSCVEDILW